MPESMRRSKSLDERYVKQKIQEYDFERSIKKHLY